MAKSKKKFTIDYKSVSSLLPLSTSSATTMCDFHEFKFWMHYPFTAESVRVRFLTSSYDGFVWIRFTCITSSCEEFYFWNLSTKWYKKIPLPREVNDGDIKGYGFGYDYMTGDYKLIRIVTNWASNCSDVDVYASESNSWRCSDSVPYRLCYDQACEGVLFDGGLYWVARTFEQICNVHVLVRFGIVDEKFKKVALPEGLMPHPEEPLEGNNKLRIDWEYWDRAYF
ncbi:F-box/kelch-repeat protein At3g06240-like [Papaver somniferum]|uniref:F-box/kelch-repeat protein At3g06240-like n=1 Tax=Papaver somniferum TaxID=3469 RepID=UPI000E6FB34C|nr:F-box/kelch-repeat protein At3g06240-like [Papaver somniferum]